ncbi:hypothetical protein ABZW30_12800 [Kitasatospora sp. NPDC004669]|uniref:hypothetical protein n=1 Tax=Kitasatospora sp. NPDC004669 TaxID=3154555 RepID=UPI0033B04DC9
MIVCPLIRSVGDRLRHRHLQVRCTPLLQARGWTERDVDGLDGWVALVEGRVVLGARLGLAVPEPVVHAEAWAGRRDAAPAAWMST